MKVIGAILTFCVCLCLLPFIGYILVWAFILGIVGSIACLIIAGIISLIEGPNGSMAKELQGEQDRAAAHRAETEVIMARIAADEKLRANMYPPASPPPPAATEEGEYTGAPTDPFRRVGGETANAGWYPDPTNRSQYRWFDGGRWTSHTSPGVYQS